MFEVALDSSSGIKVEVCRICEFVWFDAGETQTLQARPLPKPKPQVVLPQEARETIALAKVQQLAEQARGSDFDSAAPDEWWKSIAAFFGMPVEFDAPAQKRRPVVTWFLAGAHRHRKCSRIFSFAGGCPIFRINSGTSAPAARSDLRYLIFSPCRNHSSRRQHVFPSRFWR